MSLRKTAELTGAALDWAVAKCEGKDAYCEIHAGNILYGQVTSGFVQFSPSTDWAQGGPLIDTHDIAISPLPDGLWRAYAPEGTQWVPHGELGLEVFKWSYKAEGYTPLIAAMRCHVMSELGDEVEVPDELAN